MNLKPTIIILIILCGVSLFSSAQSEVSKVWVADNGDGTYKNPIIHADYSDPDVVRVGDDYYMTASSFNCVPGLPVLHSKDLVNWQLITYALPTQVPENVFNVPQHGNGVWAPCIRYHNNEFYIYYPDPDFGIYMIKAKQAEGPWSEPILVKAGKGLIDPSPLWDDDGKVYLTHAFAGSRARVKSVLLVQEMNSEGTAVIGDEVMVFDGHDAHPTVEGPKFYKANGYYYIFAPAGGVSTGWQLVLRSKNVYGPYETKTVMAQGNTNINGPHQGAWVDTKTGEHWFIHFQDKEAYGRVVHLNPMTWQNDWPVIGLDEDGDGIGEPVPTYQKPDVGATYPISTPPESDEFNGNQLGIQWQWQANKHISYGFPSGNLGFYRLNCIVRPEGEDGLWSIPNLLLQKFPAEEFTATTKITFHARTNNEETGFVVMGEDYQYISLKQINGQLQLRVAKCENARTGGKEIEQHSETFDSNEIYFRINVKKDALCTYSYSSNGKTFKTVGEAFTAKPGRWIGAKIGYFALREGITNDSGTVNIDWFRVEK
ncbi:glycoside hydrolase 43 family protein [Draconibacterium orientale]|uniref:glycoside hydrolase family 43 protein n=1 Tax=Draconibacterium orientale TaxID=1168034 RepID=UPI002A0A8C18|nr:glycoside hydrolase 43 family protein [Draconibacterium orientale]